MTARGGVILGAWPGRGIGGGRGPSFLGHGVRCVGSNAEDSKFGNTTGIYRMKYEIREFDRKTLQPFSFPFSPNFPDFFPDFIFPENAVFDW